MSPISYDQQGGAVQNTAKPPPQFQAVLTCVQVHIRHTPCHRGWVRYFGSRRHEVVRNSAEWLGDPTYARSSQGRSIQEYQSPVTPWKPNHSPNHAPFWPLNLRSQVPPGSNQHCATTGYVPCRTQTSDQKDPDKLPHQQVQKPTAV